MKTFMVSYFNSYYGLEVVRKSVQAGLNIDGIIFVGDKPNKKVQQILKERTPKVQGPTISDLADLKIPVYFVKNLKDERYLDILRSLSPDVLLQGGGPIYSPQCIEIPNIGILNCHPGLLPKYRGCGVVEWAIYNDDPLYATCHFLDEGIDTGPVICTNKMDVMADDSYEDIRTRMFYHQVETLTEGLRLIEKGLTWDSAHAQEEGKYWKYPDEAILQKVYQKIENKEYQKMEL